MGKRDGLAEVAVLGACLADPDAVAVCAPILEPEDFARPEHQRLWRVMLELWRGGTPPDLTAVAEELGRRDMLQGVGGLTYLTSLVAQVATTARVEHHARMVAERARLRRIAAAAQRAQVAAQDGDLQGALAAAVSILTDAVERGIAGADLWAAAFETLDRLHQRAVVGEVPAVATGIAPLDQILDGGLWPADLVILAARPSVGKTAWLLQVATYVAASGRQVLMFSLEQAVAQLAVRVVAAATGRPASTIRTGRLTDDEWHALFESALSRTNEGLHVVDTPGLTVDQMMSYAQVRKARAGLDLVVVDYLQLVGRRRGRSREEEVAAISAGLKALAKQLAVPVLAAAQLARRTEDRDRPQLSDLRESGAIEQDADVVMFLWRPKRDVPEQVRLTVAKHRQGTTGEVDLEFDRQVQRFYAGGGGLRGAPVAPGGTRPQAGGPGHRDDR